jgi:hypothetical protein
MCLWLSATVAHFPGYTAPQPRAFYGSARNQHKSAVSLGFWLLLHDQSAHSAALLIRMTSSNLS